ncbi:hypothetical protein PENSPDRAFT_395373 [Peniophora sp. CONT]|nr:hypothetical protein PENSPDRAFT_395373 [Peniophora sp. CONT]
MIQALIRDGCLVEIEARVERIHSITFVCLDALNRFKSCALATNSLSQSNTLRKTMRQGFHKHCDRTLDFLRRARLCSTTGLTREKRSDRS